MALTLAETRNRAQDKLSEMIIDLFRESPLMDYLIYENCVTQQGTGGTLIYNYNRVSTYPTAEFRGINTEFNSQEAKRSLESTELKIFGGSFQLDRVIHRDMQGIVSEVEFQLRQKLKASRALFNHAAINGDSATNVKEFDGLDKILTGTTTETKGDVIDLSTATAIEANWKAFIKYLDDMIESLDETPDMLLMSKKMYAAFKTVANIATGFTTDKDNFGRKILLYDNIPLVKMGDRPGTSEPIIATGLGTDGVTDGCTSIYAIRVGLDGVHAVTPSGDKLIHEYMPNFELPGAVKTGEVEMVSALVVKSTRSAGVIRDLKIA